MKGLSVILTVALLALARRMKSAAVLPAESPTGVHSHVLDSTFNASAALNHAETILQK